MQVENQKIELSPIMAELEKDKGIFTKQNPYCVFHFGGKDYRSHTDHEAGKRPIWLDHFHIETIKDCKLKIQVYGEVKLLSDSFIGEGAVSISAFKHKAVTELWIPLHNKGIYTGRIMVQSKLEGFNESESRTEVPPAVDRVHSGPFGTLSDALENAGFEEAVQQKGTKLHGDNSTFGQYTSHKNNDESKSSRGVSASLTDILDKWGFQESKESQIGGPTHLPSAKGVFSQKESYIPSKEEYFVNSTQQNSTISSQSISYHTADFQDSLNKGGFKESNPSKVSNFSESTTSTSVSDIMDKSKPSLSSSTKISGTSNV